MRLNWREGFWRLFLAYVALVTLGAGGYVLSELISAEPKPDEAALAGFSNPVCAPALQAHRSTLDAPRAKAPTGRLVPLDGDPWANERARPEPRLVPFDGDPFANAPKAASPDLKPWERQYESGSDVSQCRQLIATLSYHKVSSDQEYRAKLDTDRSERRRDALGAAGLIWLVLVVPVYVLGKLAGWIVMGFAGRSRP